MPPFAVWNINERDGLYHIVCAKYHHQAQHICTILTEQNVLHNIWHHLGIHKASVCFKLTFSKEHKSFHLIHIWGWKLNWDGNTGYYIHYTAQCLVLAECYICHREIQSCDPEQSPEVQNKILRPLFTIKSSLPSSHHHLPAHRGFHLTLD